MIGWQEWILIIVALLLLFGAKRLPEIAQGLGKGIREFKKAMKDTSDEMKGSVDMRSDVPPTLPRSTDTKKDPNNSSH